MIHYATIGVLIIAIIVQIFSDHLPTIPVHVPTWAIYTFYALVLVRWPIGPFLLNKLSKGTAIVDSVSLRSIKGIRFTLRNVVKVECDRLGYSIHLFGRKANRRLGITFDGLKLELLHVPSSKTNAHLRNASLAPEPSPLPHESHETLAKKAAPMLEWLKWVLPEEVVVDLDEAIRAWIRYFFGLYVDLVLQVGPSIISTLSIQFNDVQVTFVELNRVNFNLAKASLGVAVNLEVVKELQMTEEQRKELKIAQRSKAKTWTDRLTGSVSRTFQSSWRGRQGTASISLKLEEFTLFNPNPPPAQRARAQSSVSIDSGWVHFTDIEMDAPENAVIHIPGETEFSVICDFDPRKGRIAHHSARVRAGISDVTVYVDVLQGLLNDVRSMMPTSPTSPKQRNGFPSSPMTPMSSMILTGSPPVSPPVSPPLSPRMSATRFFSPPRARMPPKPKERNIIHYFNSVGVEIPRFTLQYTSTKSRDPIQYRSQIIGLDLGVKLSDPAHDEIHVKWLGRNGKPSLETCKAWFRFTDVIVHRDHALSSEEGMVRIVKTAGLDAQVLLHQFPAPMLLKRTGDVTDSFIACEINMESIEATESLSLIRKRLARPSKPKAQSKSQTPPQAETFVNPPRVFADVRIGDIKGRLICDDEDAFPQDVGLDLSLDAAEFHIRSDHDYFKSPQRSTKSTKGNRVSDCYPAYTFNLNAAVHSPLLRVCHAAPEEDMPPTARARLGAPSHGGLVKVDDPVFFIEGFEFGATGNLLGKWSGDDVVIERSTLMTDAYLIIDVINIELWTLSSLDVLVYFITQLNAARTKSRRAVPDPYPSTTNILDDIPAGVQFHAAIGSITVAATGKDINPDCTLDLYRGLLFSTKFMLRYASVVSSMHNARARHRFKDAVTRDQLRLPEDLLMQAFAYSNETDDPRAVSGLFEMVFTSTTLRRIIGSQYGVEENALSDPPTTVGPNGLTLSIPRLRVRSFLTRRPVQGTESLLDKIKVAIDVSVISGHLQLLDAYCGLLAAETAKRVFSSEKKSKKPPQIATNRAPSTANKIHFDLTGQIASTQLVCLLPISQVLHVRMSMVSFGVLDAQKAEVKWTSTSILVPSGLYQKDRRWEELARLPSWKIGVVIDEKTRAPSIQLMGECARIRIPNGFILSDTILSVTVAIKAAKHLVEVTKTGKYSQMATPPAEGAKKLPNISIQIESLMFEATDSPIEARLNLAFRHNLIAQRMRLEHQDAFEAKVAKIEAGLGKMTNPHLAGEWNFSSDHSVGVREARQRLRELFSNVWINQISDARSTAMVREENMTMRFREGKTAPTMDAFSVALYTPPNLPPLFRLTLNGVSVSLKAPGWTDDERAAFMEDLGTGLPRDTQFTLLVPMHLELALDSARFVLRDLPLPILNVPPTADRKALVFSTDLVIGEEIGPENSVRWVECDVAGEHADAPGTAPFNILIPKTTMPVKTYAQPEVNVNTTGITDMAWGVSFLPIMQEVMKVIDTLSTLPIDPSPTLGFWDKLRLILHWRVRVNFTGQVHVHLKGSRDTWKTSGDAVGIALCANGNTHITIGHANPENELVQFISDNMHIVVPSLKHFEYSPSGLSALDNEIESSSRQPQKVIAKLVNGVRIGMGFTFERTCRSDCEECPKDADSFHRACRMFDFKPHYEVALRVEPSETAEDSFKDFRSDFIHLGISMHSPIDPTAHAAVIPNSIHLTPRVFAHFWSWVRLFDNALTLPIRQGSLWPGARPPSEKFGRHLATLKYRLCLDNLSIAHTYKQDSQEFWANGEVPAVGVKAHVKSLRVDLHQRDQEVRIRTQNGEGSSFKFTRTKAIYATEVSMTDLYMRSVVSIFREPYLQSVVLDTHPDYESPYSVAPPASTHDPVFDRDDYTELDWLPTDRTPKFYMGEVASCPQVSFVKKIEDIRQPSDDATLGEAKMSKFGNEPSHDCLLGMEMDPRVVQLSMASERKKTLEKELASLDSSDLLYEEKSASFVQRIELLASHIEKLQNPPPSATPSRLDGLQGNWTEADWEPFENLYYVHAPKLSLSNGTRNILLQYYYESRRRRGFEYHMAASAVRFIREHAMAAETRRPEPVRTKSMPPAPIRAKSSSAVKRLFTRQQEPRKTQDPVAGPADVDANLGGFQDTETQQKHFCLLFKPQIVLRSDLDDESVIIIAANDAAIQSMNVMDKKVDDPVNGHMLTKNYIILSGMQLFSPSAFCNIPATGIQLPLEGFLDDSCQTLDYDRIVMHTNCVVQYQKYNRLRLRTSAQATPQSDLLLANIPKFTLQANSDHFASLYNVVTDLLLYADPSNRSRLDRLAAFMMNDDISDSTATASEIASRQNRIRALSEQINDFTLREDDLRPNELREMNSIAANIMSQTEELALIFDAIQFVQDRDEGASAGKAGIRLETSSNELTWNLMETDGSLLSRLTLRYLDFLWISSQDGSSANRLKIKDLEAVDGRPDAKFPEMVSKQKKWLTENPMAKSGTLLEVVWNTAAPVAGISILTNFDLSFHPINVQFDVSVGHKIQTYIFPKDRSNRYHSSPESGDMDSDRRSPDSPDAVHSSHGHTDMDVVIPGRSSLEERPGRPLLKAPTSLSRSSSHSDLVRAATEDMPRLRRARSNQGLDIHGRHSEAESKAVALKPKVSDGVAEMRARSAEFRTFVAAKINSSGICLSFRRDKDLSVIIPDITDLYFETPEIMFGNRTCSFRDLLQEFKWELIGRTGNVLLSSGGLKSFNFTGIKDRLRPGKKTIVPAHIPPQAMIEAPRPTHRQLGSLRNSRDQLVSRSDTLVSSSAESSALSDSSTTGVQTSSRSSVNGRMSTDTLPAKKLTSSSRRLGSMDFGSRGDSDYGEQPEIGTPRRRLMSLLHRTTGSPRQSPSLKTKSLASNGPPQDSN